MKISPASQQTRRAMTLIEFVVVVVLFFVVAALLFPLTSNHRHGRGHAIIRTKMEINGLISAIRQYEGTYNRLPFDDSNTNEDLTFGIDSSRLEGFRKVRGTHLVATNSDLMVVLMDIDHGVNAGHKLNPQRHKFFATSKASSDTESPGYSAVDHQYRDPWGNPYIISFDANKDGHVRDAVYGGVNPSTLAATNQSEFFELADDVMIWSLGPDGKASMTTPADAGINKDNVVSWR